MNVTTVVCEWRKPCLCNREHSGRARRGKQPRSASNAAELCIGVRVCVCVCVCRDAHER
jgi:hypothetical protein